MSVVVYIVFSLTVFVFICLDGANGQYFHKVIGVHLVEVTIISSLDLVEVTIISSLDLVEVTIISSLDVEITIISSLEYSSLWKTALIY